MGSWFLVLGSWVLLLVSVRQLPLPTAMPSIYESFVTGATLVGITTCSFLLGILYAEWPYTHSILWDTALTEADTVAVAAVIKDHWLHWLAVPKFIPYTMYGVILVSFLAFAVKIVQPVEDVMYFEYGSLAVFVIAVCCYATNIRFGIFSAQAGEWGDVDEYTGLSVIAATEVIIVFLLLGIVVIQSGLFFAKYEDDRVKTNFLMKELRTKLAQAEYEQKQRKGAAATSTATGASTATPPSSANAKQVNKKKN